MPVTKLNPDERTHRWPQVLPGSQAVLFTAGRLAVNYDDANIDVISLKTGERKTVERGGLFRPLSRHVGHRLQRARAPDLPAPEHAVRRALRSRPPGPHRLAGAHSGGCQQQRDSGRGFCLRRAPSGPGTFVYLAGKGQQGVWSISWVDSSGKTEPLHAPPGRYYTPRFSPDGKRLAFSIGSGQGDDIWVKDLDRDTPSRLSFLPGLNRWPVWTPDGKNIVFQSSSPAAPGLYWIRSDGSGEAQRLTDGKLNEAPYSFSPDGKRLAFHQSGSGGFWTFSRRPSKAILAIRGSVKRSCSWERRLEWPTRRFRPTGGGWRISRMSRGTSEVYVRPFPGPGGRWQISTGGGLFPLWSRDGRELLFQTLDRRVMAVSYTAKGDSFAPGKPRVWSETRLRNLDVYSNYDLAPDGKRLAAMLANDEAGGQKPPTHLTFLLNFFDELRRRAPVSK